MSTLWFPRSVCTKDNKSNSTRQNEVAPSKHDSRSASSYPSPRRSEISVLNARTQEYLVIRAKVSYISTLELNRTPSAIIRCCLALVRPAREQAIGIVVAISLALSALIEVHGAARERILGYAVDGEVDAASTVLRGWEGDAARFVVLAGGVVCQVAELVRRSHEPVDDEWVAGSRLQVRRVGALAVREGVEISVWHLSLARWRCSGGCGRSRRCHGDDARRDSWRDRGRGCVRDCGRGRDCTSCSSGGTDDGAGYDDHTWAIAWPDTSSRTDLVVGNLALAWRRADRTDRTLGMHQNRQGCQQRSDHEFHLQQ